MTAAVLALAVAMSVFGLSTLAGASKSGEEQPAPIVRENVQDSPIADADWTVIVYLDADNNLESSGLDDFMEMEGIGSKNGVNIIVLMDTHNLTEGTHWYYVGQDSQHFNLEDGTHTCDCETVTGQACPGELNMGDGSTLTYCIERAVAFAPAKNYLLVLWDHGGGWYGVCWDDSSLFPDGRADRLTVDETGKAIAASGVDFSVIGFDACFSGCVEFAYELRDFADYMSASITTVPGDGWGYNAFLDGLTSDSTMEPLDVAKLIADAYVQKYSKCAGSGIGGFPYVEMSVFDLSKVGDLVTGDGGIDDLAEALMPYTEDPSYRGLIESAESMTPQIQFSGEQFAFMDLGLFATQLGEMIPEISDLTNKTLALVQETVVYFDYVATDGGACMSTTGISLYFTVSWGNLYEDYGYETYEEAEAAGALPYYGMDIAIDSDWDEFLLALAMAQAEVQPGG
jgi:hypothetical protein